LTNFFFPDSCLAVPRRHPLFLVLSIVIFLVNHGLCTLIPGIFRNIVPLGTLTGFTASGLLHTPVFFHTILPGQLLMAASYGQTSLLVIGEFV